MNREGKYMVPFQSDKNLRKNLARTVFQIVLAQGQNARLRCIFKFLEKVKMNRKMRKDPIEISRSN
jgi:hypothetical protein